MVNVQAAPDPFARASGKRGLGLALLLVTAPAPALAPAESLDQRRRDGTIQAALDYVAAHAVALTPTVVALLDARLIGERIFLYVLLADREGERTIRLLLEERFASRRPKVQGIHGR
jgi:hypothetical protein